MDKGNKYKTLLDFSNGKYSYNDYLKVKHWFTQMKDDVTVREQLFNQWKEYANCSDIKSLHPVFERIQYQILLEEKRNEKKRNIWFYYKQVAAILIPIMFLSALFYFFIQSSQSETSSWSEINVPEGARVEFILPDSTSGWLNSRARLKYPTKFTRHRKVELVGEAFFNVRHKKHSDFTVGVKDMDIQVLGTKFNVSAYPEEAVTEVVLKEGKVEIKGTKKVFKQILQSGEKITYNHERNTLKIRKVEPDLYSAWIDGYLVIDNETLGQAAKKFERWYNVEITIQDDELKNFRYKATFQHEPLDEVLRFIAMTTPIGYTIESRELDSNGILKRKHVTIKLKQ